jgi:hypothetical protein
LETEAALRSTGFQAPLAVYAQGRLGSRLQALGRNRTAALLAHPVRAAVAGTHRGFNLFGLALKHLLGSLLQLALVGEIGHVGRVLPDEARLAGHFALIAAEGGLMLRLAQVLEVLSSSLESVVAAAVGIVWLHRIARY